MTDGVNNAGKVEPIEADKIAAEFDITVYTIGMGKKNSGSGFFSFGDDVDEETLTEIASIANGKYFRAQSQKELQNIYEEIDLMEKSKVKTLEYKIDPPGKFYGILFWGIILLITSTLFSSTLLKSIN